MKNGKERPNKPTIQQLDCQTKQKLQRLMFVGSHIYILYNIHILYIYIYIYYTYIYIYYTYIYILYIYIVHILLYYTIIHEYLYLDENHKFLRHSSMISINDLP